MKIIRISPLAVTNAEEKLVRVLSYANGAYALQYINHRNKSLLDLFAPDGQLIKHRALAESAYIFKSGNYILLYPPTNNVAQAGNYRYRREYVMYSRKGHLMFDDIDYFTPLADDWYVLWQNGSKNLYNNKGQLIDKGHDVEFIKFSGGYVRASKKAAPPKTEKADKIQLCDKAIHDWTICDEQGQVKYSVSNGVAVFGGYFSIAMHADGRLYYHYPDGRIGAETTLYSGCRKNIACLVNLSETKKKSGSEENETVVNYRRGYHDKDSINLPYQVYRATDVSEFNNGNFSCVIGEHLCFFKENSIEPLLSFAPDAKIYFTPDGKYWNETEHKLYAPTGEIEQENVDGIIDYGDFYVVESYDKQTLYNLEGKLITENVQILRKVNSLLLLRQKNNQIVLMHQNGRTILNSLTLKDISIEKTAF